jgi:hypothetical protein
MMGSYMTAVGPTEARRAAEVEMEGGRRLTGRITLQPLMVETHLGRYAIRPDKIKMIRFLKPANDAAAQKEDQMQRMMVMMRGQIRRARAMAANPVDQSFEPTSMRGKIVTTSNEQIVGDLYVVRPFDLEFDSGTLRLAPPKLRSITFTVAERKTGSAETDAASPRAAGEARGEPEAPTRFVRHGNHVIVASPAGDRVALCNLETGRSQSVALTSSKDAPIEVTPILGQDLVGLELEGRKITRIAVADLATGTWHPQDLREPFDGRVRPILAPGMVVYNLGRHVYAYSVRAHRWDVVDLPDPLRPQPMPIVGPDGTTIAGRGHVYAFDTKTGKWQHVDVRKVLAGGGAEQKR